MVYSSGALRLDIIGGRIPYSNLIDIKLTPATPAFQDGKWLPVEKYLGANILKEFDLHIKMYSSFEQVN